MIFIPDRNWPKMMNDDEKFFFDLEGYLILRQVLTPEEVARCNEAIDRHTDTFTLPDLSLTGESKTLDASDKQKWMHGMLAWERPWCEPFRELMVHPRIKPYLSTLLDGRYRLDHGPWIIAMDRGESGHYMHGGGYERQDFSQTYHQQYDRIQCGLTVVQFSLADEGPGDGGLALVPCSHKSSFPLPQGIGLYEEHQEHVKEIHVSAGDAILFTEAVVHGTLVWHGQHQRRALIYKYNPAYQYHARGYHEARIPEYMQDMTEQQLALMPPPA